MRKFTAFFSVLALMISAVMAADPKVRIEIDGKVYEGTVKEVGAAPQPQPQPQPDPTPKPDTNAPVKTIDTIIADHALLSVDVKEFIDQTTFPPLVSWDLGDGTTKKGFNVGHVYENEGKYKVTATLQPYKKPAFTVVWNVTVLPFAGKTYRVTNSNELIAVKANRGDRVVLAPGVYTVNSVLNVSYHLVGENGVTINYNGPQKGFSDDGKKSWSLSGFDVKAGGSISNVSLTNKSGPDMTFPYNGGRGNIGNALSVAGSNYFRNVKFSNWSNILTCYSNDVMVEGCESDEKLLMYFVWMNGKRISIYKCKAVDSKEEHIVRGGDYELCVIYNCDFTNQDRRPQEATNTGKATLNRQKGTFIYAADNKLNGPSGMGPLGKGDGVADSGARTTFSVDENNQCTFFELNHGLEWARVVNLTYTSFSWQINDPAYPADRIVNHVLFEGTKNPGVPTKGVADIQFAQ